jgi:hypothetical protein
MALAESKAVRQIKRSIESAFCSAQDRQADSGAGAPYKTRGLLKWLGVGGQPSDVPTEYRMLLMTLLPRKPKQPSIMFFKNFTKQTECLVDS